MLSHIQTASSFDRLYRGKIYMKTMKWSIWQFQTSL